MMLDEHLFRREAARIAAALTRVFGVHNLTLVEDVVQDAIVRALEVWKVDGIPDNPAAWLTTAAKRRAIDVLRRERTARTFAPELAMRLDAAASDVLDEAFAGDAIRDEQLRMMFSCCQPALPEEVQVALVLNILCGFGAPEIAAAFLTGRAAIEKRITRGKHALASAAGLFDLGDADLTTRLAAVHRALYLLFNEGYHGASRETPTRSELCAEAMRLTALLRQHPVTATPATSALAALMCLHAARLPARIDGAGELSAFEDQDRARWDTRLADEGLALLEASATGTQLSAYHVEAAIAAAHAAATTAQDTDWALIVSLYDQLLALAPSPVAAMSRAVAIGQRDGAAAGLAALDAIGDADRLASYPFYTAARGELELRRGDAAAARACFTQARSLARNEAERRFLDARIARCG
jgi:RNA polymerase sigma-70 factor (ECF subfamily)